MEQKRERIAAAAHGAADVDDLDVRVRRKVQDLFGKEVFEREANPRWDARLQGNHPQKRIRIGDERVQVDVKLAPLLQRMNDAVPGCTTSSCQYDWFGWASVSFEFETYARLFEAVWHRTFGLHRGRPAPETRLWKYLQSPQKWRTRVPVFSDGTGRCHPDVQVHFDPDDLDELVRLWDATFSK